MLITYWEGVQIYKLPEVLKKLNWCSKLNEEKMRKL